jgi:uncharacterized protein YndB with AHSA1/START domain
MVKVETSCIINRPVEEVFAYLTDVRNTRQWDSGLVELLQTPESAVGVGTRITEVRTFLGRKFETTSEVVEYEPHTKYIHKGQEDPFPIAGSLTRNYHMRINDLDSRLEGPFPITGSLTFEPTAQGTKLTWMFEMQPGGFFALAEPLFARSLRRNIEAALGDVKDFLENQAAEISS